MGNGIFTRNYDNIMALLRVPVYLRSNATQEIYTGSSYGDADLSLKTYDGKVISAIKNVSGTNGYMCTNQPFSNINISSSKPSSSGYTYLFLGSNNTEETYDDTALATELDMNSNISSSYTLAYFTPVADELLFDEETQCYKKTIHYTFVANKACSIGEMGFYYALYGMFGNEGTVLVYRRAFEEPYELEVNDTFKVDFTLIIPANPNKPVETEVEAVVE